MGGGKFGVENAISNLEFRGWKIWGGKCCLVSNYLEISKFGGGKFGNAISNLQFGVENLGRKCFEFGGWKIWGARWGVENLGSKIRIWGNFVNWEFGKFWGGDGKFGAILEENLGWKISNLEFGGWKIWGGKCYLWGVEFGVENAISNFFGVENSNLGRKMLSRISNLGEICGKFEFGAENAWGVENLGRKISYLNLGRWKIWGGKCYLELGGGICGKCYLESPIWVKIWGENLENLVENCYLENAISNLGGGKFGAENAIWGGKSNLLGV